MADTTAPGLLVTFETIGMVLLAEKALAAVGEACRVVPAPAGLSAACGYAAVIDSPRNSAGALRTALRGAGVEWRKVYRVDHTGGDERYTPLHGDD